MIRPGPPSLEPGRCPGGLVLRIYTATDPPTLVLSSHVRSLEQARLQAERDADMVTAAGVPVCLVVYDGDTGERWTPAKFAEVLG